jgi:AraC-like DNA-binding protein
LEILFSVIYTIGKTTRFIGYRTSFSLLQKNVRFVVPFMFYKEYQPIAELKGYIRCIWVLEGVPLSEEVDVVFPDGHMELIFQYGSPYKRITELSSGVQSNLTLVGQITQQLNLQATGKIGVIGIRFYPWGAFPVINIPMHLLTNAEIALKDCWGKEASDLEDKLLNSDRQQAIIILQQFLLHKLIQHFYRANCIQNAVQTINQAQGNIRVQELAYKSNLSIRQFTRTFTETVGVAPKSYSGMVRFQSFIKQSNQHRDIHLGELALRCGYYDQSHVIREFKQYTGMSPKAYFKHEGQLASLFLIP